jgi:hypothetical protein
MATGLVVSVLDVVLPALRKLGVIIQGEYLIPAEAEQEAIKALNAMAGRFFTLGMPFYREYKHTVSPLVDGTNTYSITPDISGTLGGVWNIYQAFLKDTTTSIEIPLRVVSREEYNAMTNKTQTGTPVMLCNAPDGRSVQLYLTPDAVTATTKSLILYGYKQEEVYTTVADNIVFPREWHEALIYGLAVRLAPEYGVPLDFLGNLERQATGALNDAVNWNPQFSSTYFGVSVDGYQ